MALAQGVPVCWSCEMSTGSQGRKHNPPTASAGNDAASRGRTPTGPASALQTKTRADDGQQEEGPVVGGEECRGHARDAGDPSERRPIERRA